MTVTAPVLRDERTISAADTREGHLSPLQFLVERSNSISLSFTN